MSRADSPGIRPRSGTPTFASTVEQMVRVSLPEVSLLTKAGPMTFASRRTAIGWIKNIAILARTGNYARDTAVDIFNRFVATISLESGLQLVDNPNFVSFAAAASLILASKVHEGKTQALSMSKFPDFKIEELIAFEGMMLSKLECKISALSTPTAFISTLVELWPDRSHHTPLKEKAEEFLSYFYESPESSIYAPSSIAISVLLLAFSVLRLDCSSWLAMVPDVCFPRADSPAIVQGLQASFDIDACICDIQSACSGVDPMESPLTLPGCTDAPAAANSPTSVVLPLSPEAGAASRDEDDSMDLADSSEDSELVGVMTKTFTPARGTGQWRGADRVVKATGGKPLSKAISVSGRRSRANSSPRDPELCAIEADGFNAPYPLLRSRSRQQQQQTTTQPSVFPTTQPSVFRPISSLGMPLS